jgi:pimeloyl-ACP methyl ester carboxylesterase
LFIPAFAETGATIVSPDCPGGAWNNPRSQLAILELLDHLVDQFGIAQTQVSLVGYSAGGWGAWYLLLESAERFKSAIMLATLPVIDPVDRFEENFPKCEELLATRRDEWLSRLPDLPIYMIHSRDDELLPYTNAQRTHQILVENKRHVTLDTIQDIGHFISEGYIEPLQASVPWLIDTWRPSELT